MFSVTIPFFLLSLAPTLTFGEKCGLCTGFDESLPIDLSFLPEMMGGMNMGGGDNTRRFAQSTDDKLPSSCAAIKNAISSSDFESDSPECALYSAVAYGSCGCTDDPPTDSCYACPFGGTFKKDTVPDIPDMGESELSLPKDATCGELARSLTVISSLVESLAGGLGGMGENQTTTTPASESDGMDTGNFICGMIRSPCGCDPNPDACKICEYGVENPDDIIKDDENNDQLTCGRGIQIIEMQLEATDSLCDETKEQAKKGGCVCKDSAAAYKNTVTLLVISAVTTIVAFLG